MDGLFSKPKIYAMHAQHTTTTLAVSPVWEVARGVLHCHVGWGTGESGEPLAPATASSNVKKAGSAYAAAPAPRHRVVHATGTAAGVGSRAFLSYGNFGGGFGGIYGGVSSGGAEVDPNDPRSSASMQPSSVFSAEV